jgi:hypothetical protein
MEAKCDELLATCGALPAMRMLTDALFWLFSALSDFGSTCRHADALNTSRNGKVTLHIYVYEYVSTYSYVE